MFVARYFENFNNHRLINLAFNEISLSSLCSFAFSLHDSNSLSLIFFIIQKIIVLFEIVRNRSAEIIHNRVLIIDELNKNEINVLIKFLYKIFKIRNYHFVRLCIIFMISLNLNFISYINMITH